MTSGLEASLRLSADVIQNKALLFIFCNAFRTGYPQFQLTVEPTQYTNKGSKVYSLFKLFTSFGCVIVSVSTATVRGALIPRKPASASNFQSCFACCPVPTRRGESGTNYWGPVIRKGARDLTVLHMFLSVLVLSLFVGCKN